MAKKSKKSKKRKSNMGGLLKKIIIFDIGLVAIIAIVYVGGLIFSRNNNGNSENQTVAVSQQNSGQNSQNSNQEGGSPQAETETKNYDKYYMIDSNGNYVKGNPDYLK